MGWCERVGTDGVEALASYCRGLRGVDLCGCREVGQTLWTCDPHGWRDEDPRKYGLLDVLKGPGAKMPVWTRNDIRRAIGNIAVVF